MVLTLLIAEAEDSTTLSAHTCVLSPDAVLKKSSDVILPLLIVLECNQCKP